MKITVERNEDEMQLPCVTIDTAKCKYPHAIRNALSLALELDGYDTNTINEVFNQMPDAKCSTEELNLDERPYEEYEMFFKSEGSDFCKIDGWFPIATNRIKNIEKIDEYISKGILRRITTRENPHLPYIDASIPKIIFDASRTPPFTT